MVAAKQQNSNTQLQVDVGVIKSEVADLKVIAKETRSKLDGLQFASQTEFDSFKKEVHEIYLTKEEFKPFKWVLTSIATAFLGSLFTAVAFFIVRGGLK